MILKFYRKVYFSDTEACQCLHLFPVCDVMWYLDNSGLTVCVELSDEQRISLEDEKRAMEQQLTDECSQLKRELETIREKKKEVETKLENQRHTSSEQMDRQRQGNM